MLFEHCMIFSSFSFCAFWTLCMSQSKGKKWNNEHLATQGIIEHSSWFRIYILEVCSAKTFPTFKCKGLCNLFQKVMTIQAIKECSFSFSRSCYYINRNSELNTILYFWPWEVDARFMDHFKKFLVADIVNKGYFYFSEAKWSIEKIWTAHKDSLMKVSKIQKNWSRFDIVEVNVTLRAL